MDGSDPLAIAPGFRSLLLDSSTQVISEWAQHRELTADHLDENERFASAPATRSSNQLGPNPITEAV